MTKNTSTWSDQSITAILGLFFDQGMSAGQIAREYSRKFEERPLTRNAVIGLVHRHQTDEHRARRQYRRTIPAKPVRAPRTITAKTAASQPSLNSETFSRPVRTPTRSHFTPLVSDTLRKRFRKSPALANDIPRPEPLNIELFSMGRFQCRHPTTEDGTGQHLFCGHATASPEFTGGRRTYYCAHHHRENAPPASSSTKRTRAANERYMAVAYR